MRELSKESRALLDAARDGDEPSAFDRRRVRRALTRKIAVAGAVAAAAGTASHAAAGGVATGTGAASGSAAAAAGVGVAGAGAGTIGVGAGAGAVATGLGVKLLASVAVVGAMSAGTIGYVAYQAPKPAPRISASVQVEAPLAPPVSSVSAGLPRARPGVDTNGAKAESPESAPPAPSLVTRAPSREIETPTAPLAATDKAIVTAKPSNSSALSSEPDLNAELDLLREAQRALQANDGARALSLFEEHERRFPGGPLSEEAEAGRVFSLRQVGRSSEARDLASRFLREHPRSPLAPRVARAFDPDSPTF